MNSQFQIISAGIYKENSTVIGLYLFDDLKSLVYFSDTRIREASSKLDQSENTELEKNIDTIKYTVNKEMNDPKGPRPTDFPKGANIATLLGFWSILRFSKPYSLRCHADGGKFTELIRKHVDSNATIKFDSFESQLTKARLTTLFQGWNKYFTQSCILGWRFFLGLKDDYYVNYVGYSEKELVIIKIINFEVRYQIVRKELDAMQRMKDEFRGLNDMAVTVIILSAKPDLELSSYRAYDCWATLKDYFKYVDIMEVNQIRAYAKTKKIQPLGKATFNYKFSLVKTESIMNLHEA